MEKTLLVLAAGMGSRYGGLKQMEGFGPNGETILEYNIFNAVRAGIEKVVIVIRKSIEKDFRELVMSRFPKDLNVELCFQELDALPSGYAPVSERVKPWGTGHAVWVARKNISGPFVLVNGDDFYGASGFEQLSKFFDHTNEAHAMVAYELGKTLSDSGSVSRGVCSVSNDDDDLATVVEVEGIQEENGKLVSDTVTDGELTLSTPVSMNLFGFQHSIFERIESDFLEFLEARHAELKSEFYIPAVANSMIKNGTGVMKVLYSKDEWMGVTNPQDRQAVVDGIAGLIDSGAYPKSLWK